MLRTFRCVWRFFLGLGFFVEIWVLADFVEVAFEGGVGGKGFLIFWRGCFGVFWKEEIYCG